MSNEVIDHIRRNHALEHATINVLSNNRKGFSAQGNSTYNGFFLNIYGEVEEQDVVEAVEEAYRRLSEGEKALALQPNCGTVLLTTATMATLAAQATFSLERRRQRKARLTLPVLLGALPAAVLAVTLALIVSRPVGMTVQERFTVKADLGDLRLTSIRKTSPSLVTRLFKVLLGQANNDHVHAFKIETVSG